ncbi:MAG: HlyD family efflux transporter periplasmic adaptor subunit [Bacteroidota bacterium]
MDRIIQQKSFFKRRKTWVLSLLFLLLLVFFCFREENNRVFIVDKNNLLTDNVQKGLFQEFITFDGVVQPLNTVFLDVVLGGRIEKIYIEDGSIINEGDTILKFSNSNVMLDFMNRETQMYDIINNLQNTKLSLEQNQFNRAKELLDLNYQIELKSKDYERKCFLFNSKSISVKEYEESKKEFEYLENQKTIILKAQKNDSLFTCRQIVNIKESVERMNKNLKLLYQNINNMYLRAPIGGKLSSFNVEVGETKNAGENIGTIDEGRASKIRANIDEQYVNKVFIGQNAEFDLMNKIYQLKINKIYTKINNGAFAVDFVFCDTIPNEIKRGQTITVKLKFNCANEALMIKKGGFYQETGGNWVFVVDEDGKSAVKRNIILGKQNSNYFEILDGLKANEKIIISSYSGFEGNDELILK